MVAEPQVSNVESLFFIICSLRIIHITGAPLQSKSIAIYFVPCHCFEESDQFSPGDSQSNFWKQ